MQHFMLKPILITLPLATILLVMIGLGIAWGTVVALLCKMDRQSLPREA